jgi:hypothetical protein
MRKNLPHGFWDRFENQKVFMDWLRIELGFNQTTDWYKLTAKEIFEKGGPSLLKKYGGSPFKLLQSVYPEHIWIEWKFERIILTPEQKLQLIEYLAKALCIQNPKDWLKVDLKKIGELISPILMSKYPLKQLLQEYYPDISWNRQLKKRELRQLPEKIR